MTAKAVQRRQYAEFKQMLERALSEVVLPSGIVDSNNIKPNSITPTNCKLDASWDFRGSLSAGGYSLNHINEIIQSAVSEPEEQTEEVKGPKFVELNHRANLKKYPDTDIFFLNAIQSGIVLVLPPASENSGRKLFFKRIDPAPPKSLANNNNVANNNICRIICTAPDKLDGTDGVELNSQQAVILVASSKHWYVFSKLN